MTKLSLNCPHCPAPLVYVPLDGMTLHYRCAEHGAIILRPLVLVESDDVFAPPPPQHQELRANDAA